MNTNERGSLSLEQVLFIGAIVAISIGLFAFYDSMGNYFSGMADQVSTSVPNQIGTSN